MVKLIISPQAIDDLNEVSDYIALDSEYYARIFTAKIVKVIEEIPIYPKRGRKVPEYNNENIRERIYHEYRIVYKLDSDTIEIVSISQGSKQLTKLEQ